jgi:hypothetical protein
MTHMSRAITVILVAVSAVSSSRAQNVTPEELAVRALYSQFVIGSDVKAIQSREAPGMLSIQLSDFRTGPLSAITNEAIRQIVTIPSVPILSSGSGRWSMNEQKLCATVYVEGWRPISAKYGGAENQNWQAPFSELLKGFPAYESFASYATEVSFQGQSRRYRALALLSVAEGRATIIDYILGGDTIIKVGHERDFPHCLAVFPGVLDPLRKRAASSYVESLRMTAPCVTEPYTGLCCDPAGGKCGLPASR